jgi:hypothetical protein
MADGLGRELRDLLFSDATAIGGTPAAEHVSAFSIVFSTHPARVGQVYELLDILTGLASFEGRVLRPTIVSYS